MGATYNYLKIAFGLTMLVMLAACGSTHPEATTVSFSSSRARLGQSTSTSGCSDPYCSKIFASSESAFQTEILKLLDSADFGSVGPVLMANGASLGLNLGLQAKLNPNGNNESNIVPQNSRMQIVIRDQVNGQTTTNPILITMDGGSSLVDIVGHVSDRDVDVVFIDHDEADTRIGMIEIIGTIKGATFDGFINFQNDFTDHMGYPQSSAGVLQFSAQTCKVFQCSSSAYGY